MTLYYIGMAGLILGGATELVRATIPLSDKADRRADRISVTSALGGITAVCFGVLNVAGLL